MIKKHSLNAFLFLVGALLFVSCDSKRVYDNSTPVLNLSWDRANKIEHSVYIDDTTSTYNLFLNVRNGKEYQYSNLYVFLTTTFPKGEVRQDTIECLLADKKGVWYGKSTGTLVDNKILFRRNILFKDTGTYVFGIEQAMRNAQLEAISDVGIRVEKTR